MTASATPLLLIAWRRPHTLRQVIDAIRPVAPTRLFVACDGPNPDRPGEAEKVAATRQVIEQEIDWPCQIERLYSDVNQGCRLGVSRAISWFFEQVEEGIILEDDCVPHPDFFPYCASLLERYRHDLRVWESTARNSCTLPPVLPSPVARGLITGLRAMPIPGAGPPGGAAGRPATTAMGVGRPSGTPRRWPMPSAAAMSWRIGRQ